MKRLFLSPGVCGALATTLIFHAGNLFATTVSLVGGLGSAGDNSGSVSTYHQAYFNTPSGMAMDSSGNLWLADRNNNAIRKITTPEQSQGSGSTTSTFQALPGNLIVQPIAVAFDSIGNLYILDYGNGKNGNVLEYNTEYYNIIATNAVNLTNAAGMAIDGNNNIYVTVNSNQILEITAPGVSNLVTTITNVGTSLQGLVFKRSGSTAGMIAVCDSGRSGIYLVNPTGGAWTTNSGFNGVGDFPNSADIAPPGQAKFSQPMDVAEAGDGSLIVSDYGNDRVKVVRASDNSVTNLYGVDYTNWVGPYPGFSSNLTPESGASEVVGPDQLGGVSARLPNGVIIVPDGTIFVTEEYYDIIREVASSGVVVPPPGAPLPPTGLTATAGYGQIVLSWTASAGATNYDIERATNSGGPYTITGYSLNAGFTDTNITDGLTYYYAISAVNSGGGSPLSGQASATPLFSPPPTITGVITNYGSVTLTWTASAGATSYIVESSYSSSTNYQTLATTSATTYTDNTAENGVTTYYVIEAVNGGGINSTYSTQVAVTPPLPPVSNPQIGWVTYPLNVTDDQDLSVFNEASPAGNTFNNDVDIVISNTSGTEIFFTSADTTVVTNVPNPTASSSAAPVGYANNQTPSQVESAYTINNLIPSGSYPNVMIKAIGEEQGGYPNSAVVAALLQFVVGTPSVIGTNAGQFEVTNVTVGSDMYYTYAYNANEPSYPNATNPAAIEITNNSAILALSFPLGATNLTFEIAGYRQNYAPSAVYTNIFALSNFVANTISFGFASGPGSSQFVASPGQYFVLPVGLSMLPTSPSVYGLQFNITLSNLTAHAVDPSTINFVPLLGKPDPNDPGYYLPIPPMMFVGATQPNDDPNAVQLQSSWYQSLQFLDTNNEDLLGLGWLEIYGRTNLYNTLSQNLLTYPILEGNDPYPPSQAIVGGYTFGIPTNATPGDIYQVQIGLPSATAFPGGLSVNPYGVAVGIVAPVETNLLGPGSVNALKNVTIGQIKYLVGDVHPANWFNAGDFGESNLDNLDVSRVFDAAVYGPSTPPFGSDLFDAYDSCGNYGIWDAAAGYYTNANNYSYYTNFSYTITNNTIYENTNGVAVSTNSTVVSTVSTPLPVYLATYFLTVDEEYTNFYIITNADLTITTNIDPANNFVKVPILPGLSTVFSGNDTNINQIAFGDGVLDVCDVYVTFRRSLDTNNLLWFERFWTNGVRVAIATNAGSVIPSAVSSNGKIQLAANPVSSPFSVTNAPLVNFTAGDFQATAGQTIQIPVTAAIFGNYPLRVLMLNLTAVPLDGSPALTTPISFSPNAALGTPYLSTSSGNNNYAAAWLNSTITGLSNNATIGTLTITIPANATSMSAYAIHFDHASGSPNGIASFPKNTLTGLITLSSRNNSSYGDGIPDSWRLRYFGTTNNLLSVSNADADGTGMNNWQKYLAGLNPVDPTSILSPYSAGIGQPTAQSQPGAVVSWPSVYGVEYVIQRSTSLFPAVWTSISTNTGTGNYMEIQDSPPGPNLFYRVKTP